MSDEMISYKCKYCGQRKMQRAHAGKPIPHGLCIKRKDSSGKVKLPHVYEKI